MRTRRATERSARSRPTTCSIRRHQAGSARRCPIAVSFCPCATRSSALFPATCTTGGPSTSGGASSEFLRHNQETVERGFYHRQLLRFFAHFPRESFLTLIYEDWVRDPGPDLERIAAFLGLQVGWRDPAALVRRRLNEGRLPRFPAAFAAARRVARLLNERNLDGIVRHAKRLGLPDLFGRQAVAPRLSRSQRSSLQALYLEEIDALETLLQRDLAAWRPAASLAPAAEGADVHE